MISFFSSYFSDIWKDLHGRKFAKTFRNGHISKHVFIFRQEIFLAFDHFPRKAQPVIYVSETTGNATPDVRRKGGGNIVRTSHLILPNNMQFARSVMTFAQLVCAGLDVSLRHNAALKRLRSFFCLSCADCVSRTSALHSGTAGKPRQRSSTTRAIACSDMKIRCRTHFCLASRTTIEQARNAGTR